MSTKRYVNTAFWDDEWVQTLDPSEKLMYLYLLTNPLTNIAGVYKIATRRIIFDTGFNSDIVTTILDRFQKAGKVVYFDGYIILPNWPKNQNPTEDVKKGIARVLAMVPGEVLEVARGAGYPVTPCTQVDGGLNPPSTLVHGGSNPPSTDILNLTLPNLTIPNLTSRDPRGEVVDNSAQEESLYQFALAEARKRPGVKAPEAFARKVLMQDDAIKAAWRKATAPPPKQYPAPPACKCGADACYVTIFPGDAENVRRCMRCRTAYEYDETWNQWTVVTKEAAG